MPDGCVPWENLWAVAVMQFGQSAEVAWRMSPDEVWTLIDMREGANPGIKSMDKTGFEKLKEHLRKKGRNV